MLVAGFNGLGECGRTKRWPAVHVVSAANLFKYLLSLVLGLWPENVFQINSVKTWMNWLTLFLLNGFKFLFIRL